MFLMRDRTHTGLFLRITGTGSVTRAYTFDDQQTYQPQTQSRSTSGLHLLPPGHLPVLLTSFLEPIYCTNDLWVTWFYSHDMYEWVHFHIDASPPPITISHRPRSNYLRAAGYDAIAEAGLPA